MNATNDTHGRGVIIVLQGESTRPLLDAVRALHGLTTDSGLLIEVDDMTFDVKRPVRHVNIHVDTSEYVEEMQRARQAMERFANSEAVIIAIRKTKQATEDFKKTCSQLKPAFDSKLLMPYMPAMPVFACKDSHSDVRGDFVVRGGRIVKVWNPWHSIWEFWRPIPDVKCQPIGRARPWAGGVGRSGCPPMNRGRSWDRKKQF